MSCPECLGGAIHDHVGEFRGKELTIHGKTCYVASPPSPSRSDSVIIYLTDSFGLKLINTKLLADRFAAETGFKVLVPDVIPCGGGSPTIMTTTAKLKSPENPWDILGQLKRAAVLLSPAGLSYIAFALRIYFWSTPQRGYAENILPFVQAVRAELPAGAKLGVVGFCWGGWGSTNLCKEPAPEGGNKSLVDVQFCGHPYNLKAPDMIVEAVRKYKVPFSMAVGDEDVWLKREAIEETQAALRQFGSGEGEGGYNYEIEVYSGCTHGFVVRAQPGNIVETEAAERARAQAMRWLRRYLCEAE
jgi:dienelactone hydrolase